jgi:hypothetical protein
MKSSWKRKLTAVIPFALMVTGDAMGSFQRDVVDANSDVSKRRLEDSNAPFQYDLTKFSVRFDRCQNVKMFDDELAESQYTDTVLTTMHFVLFRLCPSDDCASCPVYGRYLMPLDDYLKYTVKYQKQEFESMCKYCRENCNKYGDYCTGCSKLCYQFDNLEALGYVDASNYIECQKVQSKDNGDDQQQQLYIGPLCSDGGSSVLIGLFTDKYCDVPYTGQTVEQVLDAKISYHLISNSYSNDGSTCLSCKEPDEDDKKKKDDKDQADLDDVNQMCETLYTKAAKCESPNGLHIYFAQTSKENQNQVYDSQAQSETEVCTYIQSMIWNSYTSNGEINYQAKQDEVIRKLMPLQKAVLCGLSAVTVMLVVTALCLYRRIERKKAKVDLASQGDTEVA